MRLTPEQPWNIPVSLLPDGNLLESNDDSFHVPVMLLQLRNIYSLYPQLLADHPVIFREVMLVHPSNM
jgi:hypothetical protein